MSTAITQQKVVLGLSKITHLALQSICKKEPMSYAGRAQVELQASHACDRQKDTKSIAKAQELLC